MFKAIELTHSQLSTYLYNYYHLSVLLTVPIKYRLLTVHPCNKKIDVSIVKNYIISKVKCTQYCNLTVVTCGLMEFRCMIYFLC